MQPVELCGHLFSVDGRGEESGFLARGKFHHLYLLVVADVLQKAHLILLIQQGRQFDDTRHLVADGEQKAALVVIYIKFAQKVVERGDVVAEAHDIVELAGVGEIAFRQVVVGEGAERGKAVECIAALDDGHGKAVHHLVTAVIGLDDQTVVVVHDHLSGAHVIPLYKRFGIVADDIVQFAVHHISVEIAALQIGG